MDEIIKIISSALDVEISQADMDKKLEDVCDWDSFSVMSIVSEIEEIYGASISVEQIIELENIQDLCNFIYSLKE